MRIEILFPETANLFGDLGNVRYLRSCLPQGEFVETALNEEPRFLTEPMDLVYLGPMTERTQEKVIEKLMPHKERIRELIEQGRVFLFRQRLRGAGDLHRKGGRQQNPLPGPVPPHRQA